MDCSGNAKPRTDAVKSASPKRRPVAFDRMNALIASGLLNEPIRDSVRGGLRFLELKVWLIYHKYADADGNSYPDLPRLVEHLGHGRGNHICAARDSLVQRGLLSKAMVQRSDGEFVKGFHLNIPKMSQVGTSANSDSVPNRDAEMSQVGTSANSDSVPNRDAECPGSGHSDVPNRDFAYKDEQIIEQIKEQTNAASAAAGQFPSMVDSVQTRARRKPRQSPPGYSVSFQEFWNLYPRHRRPNYDKARAWQEWQRLALDLQAAIVIQGLRAWTVSRDWTKNDGEYVVGVLKFLGGELWKETPKPAPGSNGRAREGLEYAENLQLRGAR
jgi:hypothetical protein